MAVAIGGAVGAATRWAVLQRWPVMTGVPWPVFAINLAGSFVLGIAMAEEWRHPRARLGLHAGVGIGFCGGLTTFSTFAVEVAMLLHHHRTATASVYVVISVLGSVGAVFAGAAVLRGARATQAPLEGDA